MFREKLSRNHFSSDDDDDDEGPIISQFAQEVIDYSSCYGTHGSISYSSVNICGRPCKNPGSYGDFSECFSLRAYGPSLEREFSPKDTHDSITFHDFVVVRFESFVLPKEIKIYETYNPGSVVRILAYCYNSNTDQRWEILWEAPPVLVEKKAREFCPVLRKVQIPTR
jgi:F-box and leucine-rich repeat protein 4